MNWCSRLLKTTAAAAPLASMGFEGLRGAAGKAAQKKVHELLAREKANENALYKAALDGSGVVYSESFVDRLGNRLRKRMADEFLDDALHPEAASALRAADEIKAGGGTLRPDGSLIIIPGKPEIPKGYPIRSIENLRKIVGRREKAAIDNGNKESARLAGLLKEEIDDMLASPDMGDVIAGDAKAAINALIPARAAHSCVTNAETLMKLKKNSYYQGEGVNETSNTARQVRDRLNKIREYRQDRSYTPEQKGMLRSQIMGSKTLKNLARWSPQRNVLGSGMLGSASYVGAGPLGTAAAIGIPAAANALSNRAALRGVDKLARSVLQGGFPETALQSAIGRARDVAVLAVMGNQEALVRALRQWQQLRQSEEEKK